MGGREWWPAFMQDECMPPGRQSAAAWLRYADHNRDVVEIGSADDWPTERDRMHPVGAVVDFVYCDDLGEITISLKPDGRYDCKEPVPDGANAVWVAFDVETLSDDLQTIVDMLIEDGIHPDGETVRIRCARWSESIPHRIMASETGLVALPLTAGAA